MTQSSAKHCQKLLGKFGRQPGITPGEEHTCPESYRTEIGNRNALNQARFFPLVRRVRKTPRVSSVNQYLIGQGKPPSVLSASRIYHSLRSGTISPKNQRKSFGGEHDIKASYGTNIIIPGVFVPPPFSHFENGGG